MLEVALSLYIYIYIVTNHLGAFDVKTHTQNLCLGNHLLFYKVALTK